MASHNSQTFEAVRVLMPRSEHSAYRELGERLRAEGFLVTEAADGRELLAEARDGAYDFLICDLVMAGLDGLAFLRSLRSAGQWTPALVYATRSAEVDAILAFELGADDFLVAPHTDREVVARIRAILRRGHRAELGETLLQEVTHPARVIRFGSLEIDEDARDARVDGRPLNLRPREFALLLALAKQPGVALSRKTLVDRVWGYDYYGDERTVDNHVRQIRAKLESTPSAPAPLRTIYGFGYRFEPFVQAMARAAEQSAA